MPIHREDIALLAPQGSVGVECGVAAGELTRRFLDLGHFQEFHAVDKWDDVGHPESQYKGVVDKLAGYEELKIWRMTAQQWLMQTPDESLGFIYIDCYAHTGQDNGEILELAWPKLQDGGLFAGDDYDKRQWPKTFECVNRFAAGLGRSVSVWDDHLRTAVSGNDRHASWWFRK